MLLRICSAAILTSFAFAGAAQAQTQLPLESVQLRTLFKMPDQREEFVRQCVPHMAGRWAHPDAVCGCLHDHAAAVVDDADLRQAVLRGISETGVPTIETDWVPRSKQSEIGPTFTKIAKPTLQCMFEPSTTTN
ncbi:hypothetical protein UP10_16460 [Bradyrhizobium sp. LTSPM299]|jgi:hypothetical protein|uniref:hypothetical protein n=1 Tax=Bradyrhizobium sp. LTSPM299 TaxID=1619233 RepID=UPI0005CB2F9E|nr:hypothetical protein [Bradyrhizobium sp. LTSPM299]KJC59738.1 hypothetical protein UP10_16460 [Bradyrhizobium sp. LTSPM299]